jgi:hypothetical protein
MPSVNSVKHSNASNLSYQGLNNPNLNSTGSKQINTGNSAKLPPTYNNKRGNSSTRGAGLR